MESNTCRICLIELTLLKKLKCSHSFCRSCLEDYLRDLIKTHYLSQSSLICPQEGCGSTLDIQIIKNILSVEDWKKFKEISENFEEMNGRKGSVGNEEDDFTKLIREKGWKKCPVCGSLIEKTKKCNYVRCESAKCQKKTIFCYVCGLLLKENEINLHYVSGNAFLLCEKKNEEPSPIPMKTADNNDKALRDKSQNPLKSKSGGKNQEKDQENSQAIDKIQISKKEPPSSKQNHNPEMIENVSSPKKLISITELMKTKEILNSPYKLHSSDKLMIMDTNEPKNIYHQIKMQEARINKRCWFLEFCCRCLALCCLCCKRSDPRKAEDQNKIAIVIPKSEQEIL